MNQALHKYIEAASGLTNLTKERAERVVKQLVRQGEAAADQAGDLVEELLERSRKNRDTVSKLVKSETQRAVKVMGFATSGEVDRLERQVADLKRQLADVQKAAAKAPATKQSAAKKSTAKKATKKASKKATAKKSSGKKATAKKSSS